VEGDNKFDGIYNHSIYFNFLDDPHHGKEIRSGREERIFDIDSMSRDIGWMDIHIPWKEVKGKFYGLPDGEYRLS
jgi:hypothetical protein